MRKRVVRLVVGAVLFVGGGGALHAAGTLTLCSQNTLHLGYSSTNQNKVNLLRTEYTACDLIMQQEVMRKALETGALPQGALRRTAPGNPGDYTVVSTDLRGATSYKEAYAWLVKNTFVVYPMNTAPVTYTPGATVANKFSRPPGSVLVQTGTTWTWFCDIHSIFGKLVSERENEAKAMKNVGDYLAAVDFSGTTYNRIVMGGDWNIAADSSGFTPLKTAGYTVEPNVYTSLTKTGGDSEKYDHFAWSNTVTVTNAARIPQNGPTWRAQVSDHLGISCTVAYP